MRISLRRKPNQATINRIRSHSNFPGLCEAYEQVARVAHYGRGDDLTEKAINQSAEHFLKGVEATARSLRVKKGWVGGQVEAVMSPRMKERGTF